MSPSLLQASAASFVFLSLGHTVLNKLTPFHNLDVNSLIRSMADSGPQTPDSGLLQEQSHGLVGL